MNRSFELERREHQPAYRRIANGLRHQILAGELSPGDQLPSKTELITIWRASSFTIHTAVQALIKEGWVESIRGAGTYVARPENRFVCAGIYHGADICSEEETPFTRRLHVALLECFRLLEKETIVFMDTRPKEEQHDILPSLADAVYHRRIQCLVFPIVNSTNLPALSALKLPTATLSYPSPNMINFDMESLFREGMRSLIRKGCRSVGILGSIPASEATRAPNDFYQMFEIVARDEGLMTKKEWIRRPAEYVSNLDLESLGYAEIKNLWNLNDKPDGVIVYPDTMARGVITGVLDLGRAIVNSQMKFVFHRNAHLRLLCPFPVTWAISDEDKVAEGLIQQIQKQFRGERPSPILLSYHFQED